MRKFTHPVAALLACAAFTAALSYAAAPKNLDRAIEVQRALIVERPADSKVQNDLGSLLVLADDLEGAEQAYLKAIELDGENASANFNLALLYQQRGDRRAALDAYQRTLEIDPRHAWAHYQVGMIRHAQGNDSAARKAYAKALALDPSLGDPVVNPHLIENELATAAMLYAYHHYREELLPAKEFEEPARIAGVLIDRPEGGVEAASGGAELAGPQGGITQSRSGSLAPAASSGSAELSEAAPPNAAPAGDTASRTLSSRDLQPGAATNQITGGSVVGRPGARAGGASAPITSGSRGRTRDTQQALPRPTLRSPSSNPSAPPPTVFEPTTDSTGRIETRLVEIDEWS